MSATRGVPAKISPLVSLCNLARMNNKGSPPYSLAALMNSLSTVNTLTVGVSNVVSLLSHKSTQNLFDPVLYLDADTISSGATTWTDLSGNGYDFTIPSGTLVTDSNGVKYMNFSILNSCAKRVVASALSDVPAYSNATLITFNQIYNSTADWRTLIRAATAAAHPVILNTGANTLGAWYSTFKTANIDFSNISNIYTQWNMMVWKLATTSPEYQFKANNATAFSNVFDTTMSYQYGFASIGAYHNANTNPSSAFQPWGNIALVLYYNKFLTDNQIADIYKLFVPRFFNPSLSDGRAFDSGKWVVLYETLNSKRDVNGYLTFSVNNSSLYTNSKFTRFAYYMQNRMNNSSNIYWAFVSMDAYSSNVTDYRPPELVAPYNSNTQRNTSNLTVISNHPQVDNEMGVKGRLEITPWNYATTTVFGDGSGALWDYDDTLQYNVGGHGCLQVHNMTRKSTVFAWNMHIYGGTNNDIGFGTNNTSNIHYASAGQPDWTFAANGNYDWKLQVLIKIENPVDAYYTYFKYDASEIISRTGSKVNSNINTWPSTNNDGSTSLAATSSGGNWLKFENGIYHVSFVRRASQYFSVPTWAFNWMNGNGGLTFIHVSRMTNAGAWERIIDTGKTINTPNDSIIVGRYTTQTTYLWYLSNGATSITPSYFLVSNGINDINFHIYATTVSTSNANTTITEYLDNVSSSTTATYGIGMSNRTNNINYIGRSLWTADAYLQGDIRELICYKTALTSAQLAPIMSYLSAKWSISKASIVPAVYYDFRNSISYSSGTTCYDLSGNNFNLTFNSTPTFNASPAYVSLTSNMYAASGTVSISLNAAYTMEALFQMTSNIGVSQTVFGFNSSTTNGIQMCINSSGQVTIQNIATGVDTIRTNTSIASGTWYHCFITSAGAIYLNNANMAVTNVGSAATTITSGTVSIGNALATTSFNGYFAYGAIYTRVLDATEVKSRYKDILDSIVPYT